MYSRTSCLQITARGFNVQIWPGSRGVHQDHDGDHAQSVWGTADGGLRMAARELALEAALQQGQVGDALVSLPAVRPCSHLCR